MILGKRIFVVAIVWLSPLIIFAGLPANLLPSGWGHTALIDSTPKQDSQLDKLPGEATLMFSEPLRDSGFRMGVIDPDNQNIMVGSPQIEGRQAKLKISPSAKTGDYKIIFSIISQDGHPVSGGIKFTVGSSKVTETQTIQNNPVEKNTTTQASRFWVWILGAVIILAAIGLIPRYLRGKRN